MATSLVLLDRGQRDECSPRHRCIFDDAAPN
jgi:hypothetical protein